VFLLRGQFQNGLVAEPVEFPGFEVHLRVTAHQSPNDVPIQVIVRAKSYAHRLALELRRSGLSDRMGVLVA
jgi:hypothetical protein